MDSKLFLIVDHIDKSRMVTIVDGHLEGGFVQGEVTHLNGREIDPPFQKSYPLDCENRFIIGPCPDEWR